LRPPRLKKTKLKIVWVPNQRNKQTVMRTRIKNIAPGMGNASIFCIVVEILDIAITGPRFVSGLSR
jgi:hypothetical protein